MKRLGKLEINIKICVWSSCVHIQCNLFQSPKTVSLATRHGTLRCTQSGKMETHDTKTPGEVNEI